LLIDYSGQLVWRSMQREVSRFARDDNRHL